jgi:predicted esterase
MRTPTRLARVALVALLISTPAWTWLRGARGDEGENKEEDEFKDLPHEEKKAGDDANKRYFLIGPREKEKTPAKGHPLLVVLPGQDGSDGFMPFVKRIHKNALGKEWLVAELVAVKWKPDQKTIWPTERKKVAKQEFSTEAFIEAVIGDVSKTKKVDPARVYALGWSSSGPALYAHSLAKTKSVVGWYIAMSVFLPDDLPSLAGAKGLPYFLDHSPEDETCLFSDAEKAKESLEKAGARVKLVTYKGGHGWHDNPYKRMIGGIAWLEENRAKGKAGR